MNWLSLFALVVTVLYGITVFIVTYSGWEQFKTLGPNEWGDFLAGTLGPMAIFWLVVGYFQQGAELRNSSNALNLQAKELKESVEQQKNLIAIETQKIANSMKDQKGKFVIEHSSSWHNGAYVEYYVDVTNLGHAVAGFSLLFGGNLQEAYSEEYPSAEMQYPVWEGMTGRRYTYTVLDDNQNEGTLDMMYIDPDGESIHRKFVFRKSGNNGLDTFVLIEKLEGSTVAIRGTE